MFIYYSIVLDNTDIFISNKDKTPVFTNGVKAYNKETLNDKIRILITTNIQLVTNKMETEKIKVNLETNKV